MVAAAAEAASVLFTLGYNNIIFVSLYNFSSRNLQGVKCFLRSQSFNTPKANEIHPKEALANDFTKFR